MQQSASRISPSFVFDHPVLRELASAIATAVAPQADEGQKDIGEEIQKILNNYVHHLPKPLHPAGETSPEHVCVLLTGSTGNLGSHILSTLLGDSRVHHVFTLNRASATRSAPGYQAVAFRDRGLPVELLSSPKLTQLVGDVTSDRFGLDAEPFAEVGSRFFRSRFFLRTLSTFVSQLKRSVTHVVHNAWRVDFNLSLSSFEKHITATRRLVDLCCSLPRPVKLLFTSSVAATYKWDISAGPVPEEVLEDVHAASGNGYGASKFVAENVSLLRCLSLTAADDLFGRSFSLVQPRTALKLRLYGLDRSVGPRILARGELRSGCLSL